MKWRDTYYDLKPAIPRRIQIALRRWYTKRMLPGIRNKWPIDESAGSAPPNWQGWPEGKDFSVVLTHDVESARGVGHCLELADLEQKHGMQSAFYFVGDRYEIPPRLINQLVEKGDEIGVHGLLHDGKLFKTRSIFEERASEINKLLRTWGAVGFRAPSMIRDLDWIGELEIEYDCSTFDTDPFEPQPEAAGTIFPYVVTSETNENSYVELPYTLPQDLTLLVLLQEGKIDTWKRKLAWIAERGGMALIITHPDYMAFDGNACAFDQYPAERYEEFMLHIKEEYRDTYWPALPRDVASFWKSKESNSR